MHRAKELAGEQNVPNADFKVMDALRMSYPVRLWHTLHHPRAA